MIAGSANRWALFTAALPSADVISFGHVFHGQSHEGRYELVAKARDALPDGWDTPLHAAARGGIVGAG